MKPNKLSHSSVRLYTECARKYFYHYKRKLRPKTMSGALLVGTSIDRAINTILETKNLEEGIKLFDKSFRFQNINNNSTYVPTCELIVYAKKDFDKDLLQEEDLTTYNEYRKKISLGSCDYICESLTEVKEDFDWLLEEKETKGFENLSKNNKSLFNLINWMCLRRKGHIMLEGWFEKVLPKIKTVLAVQKKITLKNADGDEITGYIDLIVEMTDGTRYLLDNKTSAIEYEQDSAAHSQQLILYYHACKEEYKLDGVGFVVMSKQIMKNKMKICSKCKKDGSGQRHKTCDAEVLFNDGDLGSKFVRCNGAWIETIDPECYIDIILNKVSSAAENLVIETFDSANEGIKQENYTPNLEACEKYGMPCQFKKLCWQGRDEDLLDLSKEEK